MMLILLAICFIAETVALTASPPSAAWPEAWDAMESVTLAFSVFCAIEADICSMAALDSSAAAACSLAPCDNDCAVALTSSEAEASASQYLTFLLSDEVYEHMVYAPMQHLSVASFPGLAERAFVISSFGKTYHVTGWKIAYCLAPRQLMAEFRKAHQFIVFTVHTPSQVALAEFMQKPGWYAQLLALYQGKRDIFRQALAGSRFELLPCQGTYFQCVRYAAISDEGDRAFAERLTREHGVAAIPVSAFYPDARDHGVIRFCFAKSADTLGRALERLLKL